MKSHVVLNKNKNTAQPGKSESVERSSFNFYAIRPLTIHEVWIFTIFHDTEFGRVDMVLFYAG